MHGPASLSLRELLAILLGSGPRRKGCLGLAEEFLDRLRVQNSDDRTFFWSIEQDTVLLAGLKGMGSASRARLLACFEICRRYAMHLDQKERVTNLETNHSRSSLPRIALTKVSQELRSSTHEWLGYVPFFSEQNAGELIIIEKGVRTHVNFDVANFFQTLLTIRPRGFIVIHNHPSGILRPSQKDRDLTDRLGELAIQFSITLLGHWIVTSANEQWLEPKGPF